MFSIIQKYIFKLLYPKCGLVTFKVPKTSTFTHFDSKPCYWQIRFFHKVASMPAPATDTEKLICGVIEAERRTFRFTLYFCFPCATLNYRFIIKLCDKSLLFAFLLAFAVSCMRSLSSRQTHFSLRIIEVSSALSYLYALTPNHFLL